MIVEVIRYKVIPGQETAFVEAYRQAQPHLKDSSHCLAFRLNRCVKEPSRFVLTIHWDSTRPFGGVPQEQAFSAFLFTGGSLL